MIMMPFLNCYIWQKCYFFGLENEKNVQNALQLWRSMLVLAVRKGRESSQSQNENRKDDDNYSNNYK